MSVPPELKVEGVRGGGPVPVRKPVTEQGGLYSEHGTLAVIRVNFCTRKYIF